MIDQNELVCRYQTSLVRKEERTELQLLLSVTWMCCKFPGSKSTKGYNICTNTGYEFLPELYPGCFQLLGPLPRQRAAHTPCLKYICWQEVPVAGWFVLKMAVCPHQHVQAGGFCQHHRLCGYVYYTVCLEARFCNIFDAGTGATTLFTRTDLWKIKARIQLDFSLSSLTSTWKIKAISLAGTNDQVLLSLCCSSLDIPFLSHEKRNYFMCLFEAGVLGFSSVPITSY